MAPVPQLEVNPRRMLSPHPAFATAKVEPIHQPLYSAHAFDAAAIPRDNLFFTYAIGGVVVGAGAGAIASTALHTNMEQAGALAMPKLFLIQGIRFIVPLLNATLADVITPSFQAATATIPAALADLDDAAELIYGTVCVLHVGTKDYVRTPTVNIPGNTGIGGLAGGATSGPTAAGGSGPTQQFIAPMGSGRYYGMPTYSILVPSQQTFNVNISAPHITPPTLSTARLAYVVLDGILGRETQ